MRRRHPRGVRSRHQTRPGHWHVRARVERFVEPSLLLLLRERPLHGYELIERLPEVAGEGRVDVGNLYRLLRALEAEGLVSSEWSAELHAPAARPAAQAPTLICKGGAPALYGAAQANASAQAS